MSPTPSEDAAPSSPTADFLARVPYEFARRHLLLSTGQTDGVEHVLVTAQSSPIAILNVGVRLKREVKTRLADPSAIAASIDQAYAKATQADADTRESSPEHIQVQGSTNIDGDLQNALSEMDADILHTSGKAPVIRLVDLLLFEALQQGASDVHIQPVRGKTLVRYRMDGVLHNVRELPGTLANAVTSRVKVMGRMDIAERRSPQDGRATVSVGAADSDSARRVDLRISTLPSTYGERLVIRLLDANRSPHLATFGGLGMPPEIEREYLAQASRSNGIVLSTGPTGSGKTTTLYTTLAWISSTNAGRKSRGCELNLMTVEDPVEYDLSSSGLHVSQTQVDAKKGVTFATGLRHILRQDPDVIMVGEIRDDETARIAVQASLTGHLVLSTLHTNDAASAIARLIDLGVEPFLVASSLSSVLAQRLVRKLHHSCGGMGCADCVTTGFKGRTGVFELLSLHSGIRELVGTRASASEIRVAAHRAGMVSLRQAGETLAQTGVTSMAEVTRVIESMEEPT